jgi:hypothetical protein
MAGPLAWATRPSRRRRPRAKAAARNEIVILSMRDESDRARKSRSENGLKHAYAKGCPGTVRSHWGSPCKLLHNMQRSRAYRRRRPSFFIKRSGNNLEDVVSIVVPHNIVAISKISKIQLKLPLVVHNAIKYLFGKRNAWFPSPAPCKPLSWQK